MQWLPIIIFAGFLFNGLIFWKLRFHRALTLIPILQQMSILFICFQNGPFDQAYHWTFLSSPFEGFSLSFYIDGVSALFLSLISGIGIFVHIYAWAYFKKDDEFYRCLALLQYFWLAMIGMVSSANLLLLFVFWELTTISSYFLIGFKGEKEEVRKSALTALFVTGGGGLFLLAGLLFIFKDFGTWELTEIVALIQNGHETTYLTFSAFLVLAGCITKSAQFPFHFWLPGAMAAPTPISSYLHSATMVKAGLFLIARVYPVYSEVNYWQETILTLGAITAFLGATIAITKTDIKQILAYTTVSALGIIAALLGAGTEKAFMAAALFAVVHALYKAGLFMIAGSIDKIYGTRDIHKLKGALRGHKYLAIPLVILVLSMLGIPPLIGFIGKETVYEANLLLNNHLFIFTSLSLLTNAFTMAIGLYLIHTFLFEQKEIEEKLKTYSFGLWLGPLVFAALSITLGFTNSGLSAHIINPFVSALSGAPSSFYLSLWHGFNIPLLLSFITILVGIFIFVFRKDFILEIPKGFFFMDSPEKIFDHNLKLFERASKWMAETLFLRDYRTSLSFFMMGIILYVGLSTLYFMNFDNLQMIRLDIFSLIPILYLLGFTAILTLFFKSRTGAVIIAGITGIGVGALYGLLSAPDLALTQILVETFILVLFVFVVSKLSLYEQQRDTGISPFAILISLSLAVCITFVLASVLLDPYEGQKISYFFSENSLTKAYGANVVNVILVDFRSFDTLGEITVLAIAVIGILNLLQKRRKKRNAE